MSVTLAPGKRLTVEDVAQLAKSKPNQIEVEESVLRRAESDYPCKDAALFEFDHQGPEASLYSIETTRAALIYRLHSLLALKSPVRAATVQLLADLINNEVSPFFSSHATAGADLLAFLAGRGYACIGSKGKVAASEALSLLGMTSYAVTVRESKLFLGHPFLAIGSALTAVAGANNLLKAVDPIAAMSVEAFGARAEGFDPTLFEALRQHRGQMLSAGNLKLLLEGSKRVGSNKAVDATAMEFQSIPQIVGPAQEAIAVATKVVDIELNSSEIQPLDPSTGSVVDASQVLLMLHNLTRALQSLTEASNKRSSRLLGVDFAAQFDANGNFDVLANQAVSGLAIALANELYASLLTMQKIELEEASKKAAANAEKEARAGAEGKPTGKPQNDDSNLTPEQLAKAEAKRKAKAEKAASKAAAKEQRRGGLVLGAGTTQLRAVTLQRLGLDVDGDESSQLTEGTRNALVKLFLENDSSEQGMLSAFAKIVEQLTTGGKRKPKIAKGARDFTPEQMRIREQAFNAIRKVFKRHGGVEIDTPVFELKEVLTGKYGEDSKLIYDLADQGGELLSLRYDLTVPFARFLAMNSVGNIKRYHIAKVYRRDNPQLARGRYREFYQCDFDVAGSYSPMVPDAEVITVATEILSELPVGKFMVKLNHRKILDAIFEICGVPMEKFRPICSAVDKLDKMSWEDVKAEMVNEKGLDPAVADKIGTFVLHSGEPFALWEKMMSSKMFGEHKGALDAMQDMKTLFGYLQAMGSLPYVSFDMSLARGLDYYTGVIYEVVLTDGTSQVGSIAAGGRYDNLVGMFSPAGVQTPCVGVSIGIERVFTIMEKKAEQLKLLQQSHIQVYIASIGADLMHERMKVAQALWGADISAEYSHLDNPKFKRQLDEALERGIPFMVVFGQDEIDKGVLKVKNMRDHTEVEIPRDQLIAVLTAQGVATVSGPSDKSFIAAMKQSETSVVDA